MRNIRHVEKGPTSIQNLYIEDIFGMFEKCLKKCWCVTRVLKHQTRIASW